jgi:hypothetical protein
VRWCDVETYSTGNRNRLGLLPTGVDLRRRRRRRGEEGGDRRELKGTGEIKGKGAGQSTEQEQ